MKICRGFIAADEQMTKQVSCENNRMVTGITVLQVAVEIMNVKEVDR